MTARDLLHNTKAALADCWPDKRDVPYMLAAYGLIGLLVWMVCEHEQFRAIVLETVSRPEFWQIVSVGLVVYLIAAAYLFYREWKEPLT